MFEDFDEFVSDGLPVLGVHAGEGLEDVAEKVVAVHRERGGGK